MLIKIFSAALVFSIAFLLSQDSNAQSVSNPAAVILNAAPIQATAPNQDMDKAPVQKEATYVTGENGEKIYFATEPVRNPAPAITGEVKPEIIATPASEKSKNPKSK